MVVDGVGTDVAAPHDHGCPGAHGADHPGGLGVVEDHHVARPHDLHQPGRIRRPSALEHGPLVAAQRAAVTGGPVQPVVQPLGHGEELGVALDHQPASVDAATLSRTIGPFGDGRSDRGWGRRQEASLR
jgi:hypothetical protein